LIIFDDKTPINKIVDAINNAKDGTVIKLLNGQYDFKGKVILINDKKNIEIYGENSYKTVLNNLAMFSFLNSKNIGLKNCTLNKCGTIAFTSNNNFLIKDVKFHLTGAKFLGSQGEISYFFSDNGSSDHKLLFYGSSVIVKGSDIHNQSIGLFNNSELFILNSKFSNINNSLIQSGNSKLYLYKNNFLNKDLHKNNLTFVLSSDKSTLIAEDNSIENNEYGIVVKNNSNAYIIHNNFLNNNKSINIFHSTATIINNKIDKGNGIQPIGINLVDSKTSISGNNLKYVFNGIELSSRSEANIYNNRFGFLLRDYYSKVDSSKYYVGMPVYVFKNSLANMFNNISLDYESYYFSYVDKTSKAYSNNNNKNSNTQGSSNANSKLPISVEKLNTSFLDNTKKIIYKNPEYDKLTLIKPKKKKSTIVKGYLVDDIIVTVKDGEESYEDEISKDTYMEFNLNTHKIIKPKEYKGIELDEKPPLKIDAKQRKIDILPKRKTVHSKYLAYFQITSNTDISKVLFDGKELKFSQSNNTFITKKRRIKDFSKEYDLLLSNDTFSLLYKCSFDNNKNFTCVQQPKKEL